MRDRLIELLSWVDIFDNNERKEVADYLLNNGVVVLPTLIGENVYCIATPCGGCRHFDEVPTEENMEICRKCEKKEIIECKFDYDLVPEYRKTVFLTREEAEKALKGGAE